MNLITLHPPEISAHEVLFRWDISPPSALYHRNQFTLRFPSSLDLSAVPESLWWQVALICLHSQWSLLRPCRVRLPFKLRPGEAEVWCRLLDAAVMTLEAYRRTSDFDRQIEIVDDGPLLDDKKLVETDRCATAFSGGKDSLLQVGLLTELTARPVLVAVTSPMPPLEDHLTPRRRQILREIVKRRDVELIEVESDYRANFDHGFAQSLGYMISVNELTDTFLYFGALLAAGAASGATHLFLASEAEVQENISLDGRLIQHSHFMYSTITQRVLQALLRRWGLSYSSLTSPLHSAQVQELVWTRYRDLRDLQYSCWRVRGNNSVCNECPQCLRIAFAALALGDKPSLIGVDLVKLLSSQRDWKPRSLSKIASPVLPNDLISCHLHAQTLRTIEATSLAGIIKEIISSRPKQLLTSQAVTALRTYRGLRRLAVERKNGGAPGYRPGFLKLLDPLLRERVGAIFAEHFQTETQSAYADILARGDGLTSWILAPIGGEQ